MGMSQMWTMLRAIRAGVRLVWAGNSQWNGNNRWLYLWTAADYCRMPRAWCPVNPARLKRRVQWWTVWGYTFRCSTHSSLGAAIEAAIACEKRGGAPHSIYEMREVSRRTRKGRG